MAKWIFELILGLVSPQYAKNIARHLVGAVAAWLITVAQIDPSIIDAWIGPTEAVVVGLVTFVLTLLLSIGNTKKLKGQ